MAGHSRWSNIKHKKKNNDIKKSKLFSKLANDIISANNSNNDVNDNYKLKKAVDKALAKNMNKSIINNIITSNVSSLDNKSIYSAVGENGASIIIECLNANKNRIIGELRCILNQYFFNLVSFKSIEYMYIKYEKILFLDELNDKFLFYYLNSFILKDLDKNTIVCETIFTKYIFLSLKKLNIKFSSYQIFLTKNSLNLCFTDIARFNSMISKLKSLPYVNNLFYNF